MSQSDELQSSLWDNTSYFRTKLLDLGFDLAPSQTPITPVMIYDEATTMNVSKRLLELGVFVSGIVFPTVVKGQARLRCMISAVHTKDQLDQAVAVFEQVGKEFGLIQ
jgi:glycine C-acetyltransferase